VSSDDALAEVVEFLEGQEHVNLNFESDSIGVEITDRGDLEIEVMKTRFKIRDSTGELLLRVTNDGDVTVFSDDIVPVEESNNATSVIQNILLLLPESTHPIRDYLMLRRFW